MKVSDYISKIYKLRQLWLLTLLCVSTALPAQVTSLKNGVNIQASYYNRGRVNIGWELMQAYPEIQAVRIEIEPYMAERAARWIREAHEYGYQVIATYHDSKRLGSDRAEDLLAAARWWRTHYTRLSSSGPVVINVMNEWGSHDQSPASYSSAYNEAIGIIREVYDGSLILDVPGFGQAARTAADAYSLLNDQDIIYSVHVYTNAYNTKQDRWLNEDDLAYLQASGASCMVGEFGDAMRGGADWCNLVDHCHKNAWPVFGWAWNGDGQQMNMIQPHWRQQPLANAYQPTPHMQVIIDRLAGVPCYSRADAACTDDQKGDVCDDANPYTINDQYNDQCHCTGTFVEALQSLSTKATIYAYPIPVMSNHELTIELLNTRLKGNLTISDYTGKLVQQMPINQNQRRVTLNTETLPQGVYWIAFHAQGKVQAFTSFIK